MAIIGQDNRTEVTNFDQNPLDSVVAIDGFQTGGEGSGILISAIALVGWEKIRLSFV